MKLKVLTGWIKIKGLFIRLLIKLGLKVKPWNPIEGCTLIQYEYLSKDKQKEIDSIVKHSVKTSNPVLLSGGFEVEPLVYHLDDLKTRSLIKLRNLIDSNKEIEVFKMLYGIKDFTDVDIFSMKSSGLWIQEEIQRIEKNEERLVSKKDSKLWESAGIKDLNKYGRYISIFMISSDITQENTILDLPYFRVFDRMEAQKDWSGIQEEFQRLKTK